MPYIQHTKQLLLASLISLCSFSSLALEVTPYLGYVFASDIIDANGEELTVEKGNSFGLGIAWKDGPNGLGQVLVTSTSHEFDTNIGTTGNMDVIYAHFNGVAQFKQHNYITTVSIGLGGAYYDVEDGSDDIFPSFTAALGTKYQINQQFAFVTELRSYVTLTDEDNELFCQAGNCLAEFEDSLWIETAISVGVTYSF